MQTKEQGLQPLKKLNSSHSPFHWIKRIPEDEEDFSGIGQVIAILRRRVAVIASVAVVVTSTTIIWSVTRTPTYEGKFQILVEPLKTSDSQLLVLLSETLKQNVNEITRQNNTELDYQALIEVLKSPKVIEPVVQKLQRQYPELNYGSLVGYGNNIGSKDLLEFNRIVRGKDESRVIEVSYRHAQPQKIEFVLKNLSEAYLQYSLDEQQKHVRQGMQFIEQQIPGSRLRVNKLQAQLQAFQQQHGIYDPKLQGEQLLQRSNELKQEQLVLQRRLAEATAHYQALKQQVGMQQDEAIAASALSESPQYQQLLTQLREVEAKIATESVRLKDANPVLQSLREERQKLLPLLQREAKLVLGKNLTNSRVLGFQNSVRRELTQQLAETANQLQFLEASQQANSQAIQLLEKQIKEFPNISRQYTNLQRDLEVANDTLNQLLAKREALRVDASQEEFPWRLIMPPTIPRNKKGELAPLPSNTARNTVLGGIAGVLLGALAAFLLEKGKDVFYDSEEIKQATKLPILGKIPFKQEAEKAANTDDFVYQSVKHPFTYHEIAKPVQQTPSPFLEAFSTLAAKLQSLKSQTSIRSLAITSVKQGDGKSTVAVFLAKAVAETGQRVLLVDTNLRHPQVHSFFGLSNAQGLSELLSLGFEPSEAIQRSPLEENLFVLTAGQLSSNPIKLLSSKRMHTLIDRLPLHFDLVIYDTSHLVDLIDSSLVAANVDGTLLIVRLNSTTRPSLKQALEEAKAARIPVLGFITNEIKG